MTVELGQIALVASLLTALTLGLIPMIGTYTGNHRMMAVGTSAALIQCLLLIVSFGILTSAFVTQDFSVEYVARNSNSLLPMSYRYSAVWSAHEGSLLLWELILTVWIAAVAIFSKRLPEVFKARVLGVLGWISAGFLLFILFTSNPFGRLIPSAVEGLDLNPLLQDFGLIIHPPMLYMGYVGFSVAFAFAVAAFVIAYLFLGAGLIEAFIAIIITLIVFMPVIMRVSRNIWINMFIKYDAKATSKSINS